MIKFVLVCKRSSTMNIWLLFILLIISACQPTRSLSTSTLTQAPTIESTATESLVFPLPTSGETSSATVHPAVVEPAFSLIPNGPWLVYRHNALSSGYGDLGPTPEEFVILNQDGSGRTPITLPKCNNKVNSFLMQGENSANYMADIGGDIYIFQPSQATGLLVYRQLWYSYCNTYFSGDEKGGLLASFYQASKNVSPELILYELPSGKIRERFPLVRCSKETDICEKFRSNWSEMMSQQPQWSPNGRYLAFVAVLDAASSDLFIYDTQNRNLRRLTNGPDWVGPIEWSPDGTQIIMQELLNDSEFFFDPSSKPASSVWSVSVSSNDIKLLYSTNDANARQNILRWLGDKRFIAYEGFLVNTENARNLRFVDMDSGTNKILFDGPFVMPSFDPIHETFALYVLSAENYQQGIYLVSIKSNTIRRLDEPPHLSNFFEWNSERGLFVSEDDCQNDPQSLQAFDYQGNFKCVPRPTPTPVPLGIVSYPAPNGKWNISVKNGLWLETDGKSAAQVSKDTATDVFWCPDSSCFFFSVLQQNHQWNLYRVSLPDLTIKMVDEGIQSRGSYQWLGDEK